MRRQGAVGVASDTTTTQSGGRPGASVFLVDDSPYMAESMSRFLSKRSDLKWLGHAVTCADAEAQLATLDPDVLLVDLKMPGDQPLALVRRLRADGFKTRPAILMFSAHTGKVEVQAALLAGVSGYLGKDLSPDELVDAIVRAAAGEFVFSKSVREMLSELT